MASLNIFSPSVVGADVHKKSIVCCARYLEGNEWKVATETFETNKNDLLQMAEWCQLYNPNFVLMESTGVYWISAYTYLERSGLNVYIVNPRSVKGMIGKKTDKSDAEWLATKGNDGSFKPSYIPAEKWRELRDVSRNLITLTQELTRLKNREVKMFTAMGYRLESVFSDSFGLNAQRAKDAILEGKTPTEVLSCIDTRRIRASDAELLEAFNGDLCERRVRVIKTNRKIILSLEVEIKETKFYLIEQAQDLEPQLFDLFQTIPGIDAYHAAVLVIELGGNKFTEAFSCVEKFASWLGVNPGNKESGGKRRPCKSGHGTWAIRRCLCEAAHAASHVNGSTIQSRYRSQRSRIGTKKAVISAAHYIARLIYWVATHKLPYKDPNIDYESIAFDKTFKRYVQKAINYREKWAVDVANLETGERFQSPAVSVAQVAPETQATPVAQAAPMVHATPVAQDAPMAQATPVVSSNTSHRHQLTLLRMLVLVFAIVFVGAAYTPAFADMSVKSTKQIDSKTKSANWSKELKVQAFSCENTELNGKNCFEVPTIITSNAQRNLHCSNRTRGAPTQF